MALEGFPGRDGGSRIKSPAVAEVGRQPLPGGLVSAAAEAAKRGGACERYFSVSQRLPAPKAELVIFFAFSRFQEPKKPGTDRVRARRRVFATRPKAVQTGKLERNPDAGLTVLCYRVDLQFTFRDIPDRVRKERKTPPKMEVEGSDRDGYGGLGAGMRPLVLLL